MNRRTPLLITSMIALPLLAVLVLGPNAAQAAVWNGWARCEITTRGPGYEQTDTHTWMVSNVRGNTGATLGSGSWQSAGRGSIRQGDPAQTLMVGEWAINGMSPSGQFSATTNGGVVTIRPTHSTLKTTGGTVGYVQQTINNSARTPTTFAATAWEWPFPLVQATPTSSATGPAIVGTSSGTHPGIGWGHMQASGSTVASSCQWVFLDGSIPNPPPTIPPVPPPLLPGTQPPPQQPPPAPPADPCQTYRVRDSGATQIAGLAPRSFREGERITVCGSRLSMAVLEDQFVDIASLPHLSSPSTALFVLIGERSLMALDVEISKRGDRIMFTAGRLYERSELAKDYDVLIPVDPVPKTWTGEFALRLQGEAAPVRGPPVRWMPR